METPVTPACIDRFLGSLSARGRSVNTVSSYRSDLIGLLEAKPSLTLENFDATVASWLNENRATWAPKTTGRRLTAARAFARFYKLDTPTLTDYTPPTPKKAVPHPLPEGIDGVVRMVNAVDGARERALIGLCGMAGLRCAEALTVTPNDLDTSTWVLTVNGKGDKQREVPITTALWNTIAPAVADAILEGRVTVVGYRDRYAREVITDAAERAGLARRVSSHDLRATFLTAAYRRSKDLRAVQELAGHSSSKTTEGYTAIRMDTMRDAAQVVEDDE